MDGRREASPSALLVVENAPVPQDQRVWHESLALAAAGWDVTVLAPRSPAVPQPPHERIEGITIERFALGADGGDALAYLREYAQAGLRIAGAVRRLSRRRRFAVIHAANPPDFLLAAAAPERARGTALIFDQHDLAPEMFATRFGDRLRPLLGLTLAAERLAFALADVVIATNASVARVAEERGGVDRHDVFVVRNGPMLSRFAPVPPDPGLARGRRFLLAYVGIMARQDGVDVAVAALRHLLERRRDWHAVFLGDGETLPALKAQARRLGLEGRVEFRGMVDKDEVRRTLCSTTLALAPDPPNPLTHASTLVKIPEYMALGCPVVSFDLHESRISAGSAAAYARGGDPRDFARVIDDLLDDPGRRERMAAEGRRRVEAGLAWEHSVPRLLAAYERAVAKARSRETTGRRRRGAPG